MGGMIRFFLKGLRLFKYRAAVNKHSKYYSSSCESLQELRANITVHSCRSAFTTAGGKLCSKQVNIGFQSSQEQLVNVSEKDPISAHFRVIQFHHFWHVPSSCFVDRYWVCIMETSHWWCLCWNSRLDGWKKKGNVQCSLRSEKVSCLT